MATLTRTYNQQKLFGQVYTPAFIVEKMLDEVGYDGPHALGKTILDPACGDGRFLAEVVRRITAWSGREDLAHYLTFVHGWDVDAAALQACRANLAAELPRDIYVDWQLSECDALTRKPGAGGLFSSERESSRFNYVVGNPPYIRIQHLEEKQRRYIQQNYGFCASGSTDIYLAFFELAYSLLSPDGICAFITPNTYFYTDTAKTCRDFLASRQAVKSITNYGDIQLFEEAATYSAITIFGKKINPSVMYEKAVSPQQFVTHMIPAASLAAEKVWRLSTETQMVRKGRKLKEICRIHVGIVTLCDKAYIFSAEPASGGLMRAFTKLRGPVLMEAGILRPVIKGSTLKKGDDPITRYVLFPYEKVDGKHRILPEARLQAQYPLAYAYLQSVRDELEKRDNGATNPVAWYAFGRSQGLDTSWGKKIIFSPMNATPNFILHEREDCTVYSGYFIKYDGDYKALVACLNSAEMEQFVAISSRDFRGAWKAYSKKAIEDFVVDL